MVSQDAGDSHVKEEPKITKPKSRVKSVRGKQNKEKVIKQGGIRKSGRVAKQRGLSKFKNNEKCPVIVEEESSVNIDSESYGTAPKSDSESYGTAGSDFKMTSKTNESVESDSERTISKQNEIEKNDEAKGKKETKKRRREEEETSKGKKKVKKSVGKGKKFDGKGKKGAGKGKKAVGKGKKGVEKGKSELGFELLYVDSIICTGINEIRVTHPLEFWSYKKLKEREEIEIKRGKFGLGDQRGLYFDYAYDNVKRDEGGATKSDVSKTTTKTLEEHMSRIKRSHYLFLREKSRLERSIAQAQKDFPESQEIVDFQNQYRLSLNETTHETEGDESEEEKEEEDESDGGSKQNELEKQSEKEESESEEEKGEDDEEAESQTEKEDEGNEDAEEDDGEEMTEKNEKEAEQDKTEMEESKGEAEENKQKEKSEKLTEVDEAKKGTEVTEEALKRDEEQRKVDMIIKNVIDDGPSFELNIDSPIKMSNEMEIKEDDMVQKRKRPQRAKHTPDALGSPYAVREVEFLQNLTAKEKRVWNYIYDGAVKETKNKNEEAETDKEFAEVVKTFSEDLFETPFESSTKRFLLTTLKKGVWIESNIIDCFASILNYEEEKKSHHPKRLFFYIETFDRIIKQKQLNDDQRMAIFNTNVNELLYGYENRHDMKVYEILLVPIIDNNHYYLICFDLKHEVIEVIDNMKEETSLVGLVDDPEYDLKDIVFKVKDVVVKYLRSVGNCKWVSLDRAQPKKLVLDWQTTKNTSDCGVYLMRHMDMYHGSKVKKWDCGFKKESARGYKAQIEKFRMKFAVMIVLSESNIHKGKVLRESLKYEKENKVKKV
ncbi:hypothetical protein SSX86_029157 [Deinandra increscens subsp. villosa]|uniref:Ubiquitin-like protease family profile domain-containing protein n=1 Tax=Deinandra increscens subsp. villosa TaxID=3103831 RepID=A0AAP0GJW0_9ASTR